jgi:hypothetical protein
MKSLFSILIFSAIVATGLAQNPQYAPRDESYTDPELATFVTKLLEAIDKRDQHFLYSALAIDVSGIRGDASGVADFKEEWNSESDSSVVWILMKKAIELGGVFLHDTNDLTGKYQFVFPYVYDMPLDIEDDYFSIGVVTGKNVNLREKPNTASPIKTKLTYDVIWFLDGAQYGATTSGTNPYGETEWYQVETYDRQYRGWVNWQYVYSPIWYRMFLYEDPRYGWKISAFLAGD